MADAQQRRAVEVASEVVASLASHLRDQGRLVGTERDLAALLPRAVERNWESAGTRRFNDAEGGGWLVDLSSHFDGEILYGLVRSVGGGLRQVVDVLDADRVDDMVSGPQAPTRPGDPPGPPPEVVPGRVEFTSHEHRQQAAQMLGREQTTPEDPILIVVDYTEGLGEDQREPPHIIRAKRREVPAILKKLLSHGLDVRHRARGTSERYDVTEDQIEIWSKRSQPKIEVSF